MFNHLQPYCNTAGLPVAKPCLHTFASSLGTVREFCDDQGPISFQDIALVRRNSQRVVDHVCHSCFLLYHILKTLIKKSNIYTFKTKRFMI
jgi:Tat protein secretion system quality control protein TatD with DNase activity